MSLYCVKCGAGLRATEAFGKLRDVCPDCGHVHFEDPKVAVGLVLEREGLLVLCQRADEPGRGLWSFPSGFVDAGEVLEEAALREVLEETGLVARVDRLLGAYSAPGERVVFIAYAGTVVSGELAVCSNECLDVGAFAPESLPDLAFDHDAEIIQTWLAGRGDSSAVS